MQFVLDRSFKIFTPIFKPFIKDYNIRRCHYLILCCTHFCFQMESCTCYYNLFCLWHIAIWLWFSFCCSQLSRNSILVCTCTKVWVIQILYCHWRTNCWRRNNAQCTLQTACLSPAVFETHPSPRLTVCKPLQRAQLSSRHWKRTAAETAASICLLSDGLLFRAVKRTLCLRFPASAERTWSVVLPPHTLRVD